MNYYDNYYVVIIITLYNNIIMNYCTTRNINDTVPVCMMNETNNVGSLKLERQACQHSAHQLDSTSTQSSFSDFSGVQSLI